MINVYFKYVNIGKLLLPIMTKKKKKKNNFFCFLNLVFIIIITNFCLTFHNKSFSPYIYKYIQIYI